MRAARAVAALALFATCCSGSSRRLPHRAGPPRASTLEVIPQPLYAAPLLLTSAEYTQIRLHLNIYNRGDHARRITRVELQTRRRGERLSTIVLERAVLTARLRPMPWIVVRDRQTFAAAHRWHERLQQSAGDTVVGARSGVSLTHQFVILPSSLLPDRLLCRVVYEDGSDVREVVVHHFAQETCLRLPVQGRWLALAGHGFEEGHGAGYLASQAFAYDLVPAARTPRRPCCDAHESRSHPRRAEPIVAAAAGVVVRVHDGVPDNFPVGRRRGWREFLHRPRDLAGNHVVVRHTEGEFAAYLHLQPGIALEVGQRVAAGERVGRCGNSGNSLEPHLHFQLQDGPDVLRAVGLPARFGDFTMHYGRRALYVPIGQPLPLPRRLPIEIGKVPGAISFLRASKGAGGEAITAQ